MTYHLVIALCCIGGVLWLLFFWSLCVVASWADDAIERGQ